MVHDLGLRVCLERRGRALALCRGVALRPAEREFFIDNLLVRIHDD